MAIVTPGSTNELSGSETTSVKSIVVNEMHWPALHVGGARPELRRLHVGRAGRAGQAFTGMVDAGGEPIDWHDAPSAQAIPRHPIAVARRSQSAPLRVSSAASVPLSPT